MFRDATRECAFRAGDLLTLFPGVWLGQFNQVLIPLAHSGGRQTPLDWIRLLGLVAEISTVWQDAVTDPEAAWLEATKRCCTGEALDTRPAPVVL